MALVLDGTTGVRQALPFLVSQVCFFAKNTAPAGFLACNGALVSRTTYSALFAEIGTTYGAGDGSTTFALPDLRGEFIRGWDSGRGVDTGRAFATAQSGQNLSHSHSASTNTTGSHQHAMTWGANIAGGSYVAVSNSLYGGNPMGAAGDHSHTVTVNTDGGTESRPRNVALLACIFAGV